MARVLVFIIRVYQWTLSPLLGQCCRFEPSCSHYACGCIERFGAAKGAWLSLKRVLRCQPFSAGGYDPIPGDPVPGDPVPALGSGVAAALPETRA